MNYLQNTWYMAAWSEEIGRELKARTLLDRPVLLYRREDGVAVALSDRCAHRFAPLHRGALVEDCVRCPYHGLVFDSDGRCTQNPHGSHRIPKGMAVASYPLVERHSIAWIWIGDGIPDPATVPDFSVLDRPYPTMRRMTPIAANYLLVVDNILDLTHIVYIHAGGIGGESMLAGESNEMTQEGTRVWCRRKNVGVTAAPAYRKSQPAFEGMLVDKRQDIRWDPPGHLLLEIVHHQHDQPDRHRIVNYSVQILTPETEATTHYFWSVARDFEFDNPTLDQMMVDSVERAFLHEDKPIIEAQQQMMDRVDFGAQRPVVIESDAAPVRARLVLKKLIEQQQGEEQSQRQGQP